MATAADSIALAAKARRSYVEGLLNGVPGVVNAVLAGTRLLLSQAADAALQYKRRDMLLDLQKAAPAWHSGMTRLLRDALASDTKRE